MSEEEIQKKVDLIRAKHKEERKKELEKQAKEEIKKEERGKRKKKIRKIFIILGIVIAILILMLSLTPTLFKKTICSLTFYSAYGKGFVDGLRGSPSFKEPEDWCKIVEPAYKAVCLKNGKV